MIVAVSTRPLGTPESTSTGWILLFYGSGSKTGSTSGVFGRNETLFKFKRYKYYSFKQRTENPMPKFVDEAPAAPNLKIPRLKYFRLLNCELSTIVLNQMR